MKTLAVLHPADLWRDPSMRIPSHRDWAKIPKILSGEWPLPVPERIVITPDTLHLLSSHEFTGLVERAFRAEYLAIDLEYDPKTRFLTLLGLGFKELHTEQVTGFQVQWPTLPQWAKGEIQDTIKRLVHDVPVVFQNAIGAELPTLKKNFGLEYSDFKHIDDTMLAHAILWSEWPHDLEFLASIYSPYNKLKHLHDKDFQLYNWGDVIDTIAVWEALREEFNNDPNSHDVYERQSLKLIPLILEAHERGLRVNKDEVGPAKEILIERIKKAERLAWAGCGFPINLGSPKQLQWFLYKFLSLGGNKESKTGKGSIGGDEIAALRGKVGPEPDFQSEEENGLSFEAAMERVIHGANPILEARVIYANALQEYSHYILPCYVGKDDTNGLADRIYPEFKIHAQVTGRWSTTGVPMAQLPDHLRNIVCPDDGTVWLGYDWDQIELRILAALSGDAPLLDAFRHSWDIHTLTACELFGLPYPSVRTADLHTVLDCAEWRRRINWSGKEDARRKFAKQFIYRLNYGGSAHGAITIPGAKQLGLNATKLSQASNRYLASHPGLSKWRQEMAYLVSGKRFPTIRSPLGRKRILLSEGPKSLREAYDTPMQSGVSDVANLVAVFLFESFPWLRFQYQLHDGWWWGCPVERVQETISPLKSIVEREWKINDMVVKLPATFKSIPKGVFN